MLVIIVVGISVIILVLATIFLLFHRVNILYSVPLIVLLSIFSIYSFTTNISLQKSLDSEVMQNERLIAEKEKEKIEPVLSTKEEVEKHLEPMIIPLKMYFKDIPMSDVSLHTDSLANEIFGEDVSLEIKQEVFSYVLAIL